MPPFPGGNNVSSPATINRSLPLDSSLGWEKWAKDWSSAPNHRWLGRSAAELWLDCLNAKSFSNRCMDGESPKCLSDAGRRLHCRRSQDWGCNCGRQSLLMLKAGKKNVVVGLHTLEDTLHFALFDCMAFHGQISSRRFVYIFGMGLYMMLTQKSIWKVVAGTKWDPEMEDESPRQFKSVKTWCPNTHLCNVSRGLAPEYSARLTSTLVLCPEHSQSF